MMLAGGQNRLNRGVFPRWLLVPPPFVKLRMYSGREEDRLYRALTTVSALQCVNSVRGRYI